MPRRVLFVLPIVGLLMGACSDDSAESPTTRTQATVDPTTSEATKRETTTPSDAASPDPVDELLDPSLLGPRFRLAAAPVDAETADSTLAKLCPVVARPRRLNEAVQRERVVLRGRAPLPTVSQDLSVYAEVNAAASVFNSLASAAMLRCLPKLVADSGLVLDDVRVTRVSIDDVGDAAAAMRLRGTSIAGGLASPIDVELIVVTRGRLVHVVVMTSSDLFPLGDDRRGAIVAALAS